MSIVYTILILCILIMVHEAGHFFAAKLNDIYVEEFSLGMGPKLLQWGKKETKYTLRLFPIGGYVKMNEEEVTDDARAFSNKSVLQRMMVVFCGPFMNFVIAIAFFVVAFMYFGVPNQEAVLGNIVDKGPAAVAGLQQDDKILEINDQPVQNWTEMSSIIRESNNKPLTLDVQRDNEQLSVTLTPVLDKSGEYAIIGVTQGIVKANLLGSIKMGFVQTYEFSKLLLVSIADMITGKMKVELGGPVAIVGVVNDYQSQGFMYLFLLAGILSINLGVLNLLPIPGLDGSRLVFLAIEGVRGKPIPLEKEAVVHFVGLILLLALMAFVTYQDIVRLITN